MRYTGHLKFQRLRVFTRLIISKIRSYIRHMYLRVSLYSPQFLSRCSRSFNDDGGRDGRRAKSPFVCGLRNRKKRQFTLLSRTVSVCTYARLILRFSRKTSDQSEPRPMAVKAWRSRCELYMRIYPYISVLRTVFLPFPRVAHTVVFLAPPYYSPRPPFIQPDTASCLPSHAPATSRLHRAIIISHF